MAYPLASIGSRMSAQFIDFLVILAIFIVGGFIAGQLSLFTGGLATVLLVILAAMAPVIYFTLFEGLANGQTPGKKSASIKVCMLDGTPTTLGAAFVRNLLRPADSFPFCYAVGMAAVFASSRHQRIGDMLAGTIVVDCPKNTSNYSPAPYKVGVHAIESQVGNLRGMEMTDYIVLKMIADRYPVLTEETRQKLLKEIWEPFAAKMRIEPRADLHPVYQIEAVVMKYGRQEQLI